MTFNCNNYTEEEKQELLKFFKEIFEGQTLKTKDGQEFTLKELTDITIKKNISQIEKGEI